MSKFCKNCGKELIEGADVCTNCGKVIEDAPAAQAGSNTPNPAQGISVASLILGIASIVLAWFPYASFLGLGSGIAAIITGVKGRKGSPAGKTGLATAGMVLGIIGTVIAAIYSVIYACACAAVGSIVSELDYYY